MRQNGGDNDKGSIGYLTTFWSGKSRKIADKARYATPLPLRLHFIYFHVMPM